MVSETGLVLDSVLVLEWGSVRELVSETVWRSP